jgi:hypothetical protein
MSKSDSISERLFRDGVLNPSNIEPTCCLKYEERAVNAPCDLVNERKKFLRNDVGEVWIIYRVLDSKVCQQEIFLGAFFIGHV